jgi:tripartite-type tricarboxylate transporter receptor subunit TctC
MPERNVVASLAAGLAFACAAGQGLAQSFPAGPIKLVVPYAPGGPTDTVGRIVAQGVEQLWKQPVVVENQPGAGSMIGNGNVARAKPDGYTWLFNGNAVYTSKLFIKDVPFDSADLRPLVQAVTTSFILVTTPQTGVKTLADFIKLAKAKPRALNYGTVQFQSPDLDHTLFQQRAGIEMTAIYYNGGAQITTALARNEIQFNIAVPQGVMPLIAEGKLVALAVTQATRSPRMPDIPSTRELGFGYDAGLGFGVIIPTKVPDDVARKIASDVEKVVLAPEFGARMRGFGYDIPPQPAQWERELKLEIDTYTEVARKMGMQPR